MSQAISRAMLIALLLFVQTIDVGLCASFSRPSSPILTAPLLAPPAGLVLSRPYSHLSEKEQREFIKRAFVEVAAKLSALPVELPAEAIPVLKHWVDAYARRIGTRETKLWQEDLRFVFRRAVHFTPAIIQAYREQHVPPLLGVYLPMLETEYRNLAEENLTGTAGFFQLTRSTAKALGLVPKDPAQVEKMAPASARYVYERLCEFDQDVTGVCLTIASFKRSPATVRREFQPIIHSKIRDRDFWLLLKSKAEGDSQFKSEFLQAIPRFFAVAIVGENPRIFELPMLPLSSYSELPAVKPIPPDQLAQAAAQVIRDISHDAAYNLPPKVLQTLASEVEFQRYHAIRLRKMRDEFLEIAQPHWADAQQLGIKQNLLLYASMANEVFRSESIRSALGIWEDLVKLQAHFGNQSADSVLLTLAASKIPGKDNQSPLIADVHRLVRNPETERNVWFLHERGAINAEVYDFVLRVLAVGIITQELKT
jgi:hypothetical protein